MSKPGDRIKSALEDAIAISRGETTAAAVHIVNAIDVAAAREKLGMSQDDFAMTFGISPATLRNWEQGRRQPQGPARVLLKVISEEPEAVRRALA